MNKAELEIKLTEKERRFCYLYATKEGYFGNATKSYGEAYNKDMKDPKKNTVARTEGAGNLAKAHIQAYVSILRKEALADGEYLDSILLQIANSAAEKSTDRIAAIKEVNRVHMRGNKTQVEHSGEMKWTTTNYVPPTNE